MKIDFDLDDPGLQRAKVERDQNYDKWVQEWKKCHFTDAEIKQLMGGTLSPFNPISWRLIIARRMELRDGLTNDTADVWNTLWRYCNKKGTPSERLSYEYELS